MQGGIRESRRLSHNAEQAPDHQRIVYNLLNRNACPSDLCI